MNAPTAQSKKFKRFSEQKLRQIARNYNRLGGRECQSMEGARW